MEKVYLIGGLRSHIGLTGGLFKTVPAEELAAAVLQKIMAKYPFVLGGNGRKYYAAGCVEGRFACHDSGADDRYAVRFCGGFH